MSELKPCPFCGGKRVEVLNSLEEEPEMELIGLTKDNWNVLCRDCFGLGGTRRTAEEAIEAWNRRQKMASKKRLIYLEDVLEEIDDAISNIAYTSPYQNDISTMVSGMERVRDVVEDAPTVDAVEVVHGRWEEYRLVGCEPFYACSVCQKIHDQDYNYCNNCGAKMRGSEE